MKKLIFFVLAFLSVFYAFHLWEKWKFESWLSEGRSRIVRYEPKIPIQSSGPKPKLLQDYLNTVLPKDRPRNCRYVRFKQVGQFRMSPEETMTKFDANQTVSLIAPMFSWEANIKSRGIPVKVCDRLIDGNGELEARVFGSFRVAKAFGPELLRGELLRYLAELPWYPEAIANQDLIQWRQVGDAQVSGTISLGDISATVEFRMENGLIKSIFVPDRGRMVGTVSIPTPWLGEFGNYQRLRGVLVPTYGEVSWILPNMKFTYFKGNLTDYELCLHD